VFAEGRATSEARRRSGLYERKWPLVASAYTRPASIAIAPSSRSAAGVDRDRAELEVRDLSAAAATGDLSARRAAAYAEEYIRHTPAKIQSPCRTAIERELR
jgi:hypothetical protein